MGDESVMAEIINKFDIRLSESSTMMDIINSLWRLSRELVSDGYDAAIFALSKSLPMKIYRYPTGTRCWTWIVPEKWTCHDAYLETLSGKKIFQYSNNPLHCIAYSLAFEGIVKREELFKHLYTHPRIPDALVYAPKFYERDWGLVCSQAQKDALIDEEYKVSIKTEFSEGELKVGEMIIPGQSNESFVFCAHLCHTHMVNDDLTGVAVGVEVIRRLKTRKKPYYTYRLLIVPETIGSIAWLSHNEKIIPRIKGGLFLEMLGTDTAPALQLSYAGNTQIDKCFISVVKNFDPDTWMGKFGEVIGNDERQFNAPGVRIPMLSLSRVFRPETGKWPYPEYHSSQDTPSIVSQIRLEESVELVLNMIDSLENNYFIINKYKGEIFCSRFGIHADFYSRPEAHRKIFKIMHAIDGTKTVSDIAQECSISFKDCWDFIKKLKECNLVGYSRKPIKK